MAQADGQLGKSLSGDYRAQIVNDGAYAWKLAEAVLGRELPCRSRADEDAVVFVANRGPSLG
jgi:hypothetical protein